MNQELSPSRCHDNWTESLLARPRGISESAAVATAAETEPGPAEHRCELKWSRDEHSDVQIFSMLMTLGRAHDTWKKRRQRIRTKRRRRRKMLRRVLKFTAPRDDDCKEPGTTRLLCVCVRVCFLRFCSIMIWPQGNTIISHHWVSLRLMSLKPQFLPSSINDHYNMNIHWTPLSLSANHHQPSFSIINIHEPSITNLLLAMSFNFHHPDQLSSDGCSILRSERTSWRRKNSTACARWWQP